MARDITTDLDSSYVLTDDHFFAASDETVNAVILEREKARAQQKSVSRKMTANELRRQLKEIGDAAAYGVVYSDWRGRLYVHAAGWSYQGKDSAKGTTMAAPRSLGVDGLAELAFAVGTYWGNGVEKKHPEERKAWARDRLADGWMSRVVKGALSGDDFEWRLADEPMQFLAAAHDFVAADNDPAYESGVMVSKDATCSGIQIMATMLGDVETMRRVNCIPRDDGKRADVYQDVADEANRIASEIAAGIDDVEAARLRWSEKTTVVKDECWGLYWTEHPVTRSIAKRPVMVKNYGGTVRAFSRYIRDESKAPWKACMWLANLMDKVILPDLLPRVIEFMKWLQKVVRILAKAGKPFQFTTVHGLPFIQAVPESEDKRVKVNLTEYGRVNLDWKRDLPGTLDAGKQATGAVPNYVHAQDAVFLQRVLINLEAAGVDTVATVHDCFAVPCDHGVTLSRVLADTFVEVFVDADPIADLFAQLQALAGEGVVLPPPPERNPVDGDLIRQSVYLFS